MLLLEIFSRILTCNRFLLTTFVPRRKIGFKISDNVLSKLVTGYLHAKVFYNNDNIYLTMSHLYITEILTKSQDLVEQKNKLNYDAYQHLEMTVKGPQMASFF